ncbi:MULTISPECIES: RDD family protein [unclassified Streptomyces]|uniref:RDD family protein n=1 Tax=unclassified Streptomyces TaxID=2593676 RepID=UPI0036EA6A9C
MSAPTPAPGDERPREGYYPDPSIPGYVRYWNGTSWVPGTSRPAPRQGESMPASAPEASAQPQPQPQPQTQLPPQPSASAPAPAPAEETGPVFLDEQSQPDSRPEPSIAWQADASRQTGFGGDQRVSWGGTGQTGQTGGQSGQGGPGRSSVPVSGAEAGSGPDSGRDPRTPADRAPSDRVPAVREPVDRVPAVREPADRVPAVREPVGRAPAVREPADRAPADPRRPVSTDSAGGALPGMREGGGRPAENTVAIRPEGRGTRPTTPRANEQQAADGTMAIRAIAPGTTARTPAQPPARNQPPAPAQSRPSAPAQNPAQPPAQNQPPAGANRPLAPGPGGGSASWAQQVHQLAQPGQAAPPQQQQPQPLQPQPQPQPLQPQPQPQPLQPQQPQPPQLPFQGQQPAPQPGARGGQPDQPVVPWKPPVDDPFQQLVQAQASARPAGLGKRFAARLVDTVVLAALVGAIGFPLVSRAMDHIDEKINAAKLSGETVTVWLVDSTTAGLFGAVLGAFLVLGVLLEALPTAKWGRTLGKKLCGLDVRDIESHAPPSFGAALRRWLVYGVLGVLVVGVVNVLWCLFDRPWRQCWHDKAAHTFVAG